MPLVPQMASIGEQSGKIDEMLGKAAQVYEDEFAKHNVNIVIYANHLIRSAYPAMKETAELILENERCKEADDKCLPIKEILTLIPDE